uniref:Archease n=1 Tax=candidate division CPR3 bacterium TaxID=2268181 RepID=A0A7V3N4Z8_UNCC3
MPYEILDHTADFGVRIYGKSLEELFKSGFEAIMNAMVEIKEKGEQKELLYTDKAETLEDLLVDFLSEVIFRTIVEGKIFTDCELKIDDTSINAKLFYEDYDPERHRLKKEIKSVTYHNLEIRKTAEGFETNLICDV